MQTPSWRRALFLFALLIAFGGSLGILRANLLSPPATPTAAPPTACQSNPAIQRDVIIVLPTVTPDGIDTLSLNLPGPILVVPPACP